MTCVLKGINCIFKYTLGIRQWMQSAGSIYIYNCFSPSKCYIYILIYIYKSYIYIYIYVNIYIYSQCEYIYIYHQQNIWSDHLHMALMTHM